MSLVENVYIQKSKLFLLPLTKIKRNIHIKPFGTYVRDKNKGFNEDDLRLIVPFELDDSSEYFYYEKELLDSPYFDTDNYYETDKFRVYIYNLSQYRSDYNKFIKGAYTKFTNKSKELINTYWGRIQSGKFIPHSKIEQYLDPTIMTYEQISDELSVSVQELQEIKEILNPPDLEKETFSIEDKTSKIRPTSGDTAKSTSN